MQRGSGKHRAAYCGDSRTGTTPLQTGVLTLVSSLLWFFTASRSRRVWIAFPQKQLCIFF